MAKQPSLDKLTEELERTRQRREELDQKIRELEEKVLECRRQVIIGLVEQAELSPEQLAIVIGNAKKGVLGVIPGKEKEKIED